MTRDSSGKHTAMCKLFEANLHLHTEQPQLAGKVFRRTVLNEMCNQFGFVQKPGQHPHNPYTGHYNVVKLEYQARNDPRVVGLGRPEGKNNGGPKKKAEVAATPLTLEEIDAAEKRLKAQRAQLLQSLAPDLFTTVEQVAEPQAVEQVAEPQAVEQVAEPQAVEQVAEPQAVEQVAEPQATEPQATEPQATEPQATEPQATEPQATEPQATEPQATEPQATEPQAAKPARKRNK